MYILLKKNDALLLAFEDPEAPTTPSTGLFGVNSSYVPWTYFDLSSELRADLPGFLSDIYARLNVQKDLNFSSP